MLHDQLLEQARHLATRERSRPRQASLRRAISAAYYALFHLLVDEASRCFLRGGERARFRPRLARAFTHSQLKLSSQDFAHRAKLPDVVEKSGIDRVPEDVAVVARAFVRLQEQRHRADYDVAIRFSRREALELVEVAEDAFRAWRRVRGGIVADLYLHTLLLGDKLKSK